VHIEVLKKTKKTKNKYLGYNFYLISTIMDYYYSHLYNMISSWWVNYHKAWRMTEDGYWVIRFVGIINFFSL
jgi:hypothetical protein